MSQENTPMMQQYWDAKKKHPGMILLFRMGDFYETFAEDAETVSRELNLQLTSRDKSIAMAGFPHHSLEIHLRKLLKSGYRVAVCDQMEEASAGKKLVRREVTRVVTPGTITEDELLEPARPNYLMAIILEKKSAGLSWLELSTGSFFASTVPLDRLGEEIQRIRPAECLCAERQTDEIAQKYGSILPIKPTNRPDWTFDQKTAIQAVHEQFKVSSLLGFGFAEGDLCSRAAGAILIFLRETVKTALPQIRSLQPFQFHQYLQLDEITRRGLELIRTSRDNTREGSLISVLDRTMTPMGARLLHEAILTPLRDLESIENRQNAVQELMEDTRLRGDLRELLKAIPDLERLTSRIATQRATPRDLGNTMRALQLLPSLKALIAGRKSALLNSIHDQFELCKELRGILEKALEPENLPLNIREGGIIRAGYHQQLDEYRQMAKEGKNWVIRYQAQEIARTGIPSLKVGYNQVFGYYIEVTHAHAGKVPDSYERKQTLKNAERYITPELKSYEEKVLSAEEKSIALEIELYNQLRDQLAFFTPVLMQTGSLLGQLDFLGSLAEIAALNGYVRPKMVLEPILDIRAGRHPVLEQLLPSGSFVPNELQFNNEAGLFRLITGPNMAGKSVYIRQNALICLMAHMGSMVPCRQATIGLIDRIFARVGAGDEQARGLSTFMVEMTETGNILNNATKSSLIILDEIGRGTSTYDGVSLAWSIAEYLHDQIGARALFATHYHELGQLEELLPLLRNYQVQVQECEEKIVFLYKILPGVAERSYGIHVAQLAGIPPQIVTRAQNIMKELEARHQLVMGKNVKIVLPPESPRRKKNNNLHISLFEPSEEIKKE